MRNNFIKNLIVLVSVIALALPTFALSVSAADTETLTISGSDLYALLTTGAWEGSYTVGGNTYYFEKESFLLDGDTVLVEITNNSNWPASSSLSNVNAQFNTGFVYNNVVDISIKASSAIPYTVTHPNGASYEFSPFDSLTGVLITTSGIVDLGSATPNAANGSYLFGYTNRNNLSVNYALLQSDLDNVNVTDILFEASFNPGYSAPVTFWANAILLNIAEIELTFIDQSSDGGSGGGSSSVTQQAILNQIDEANKKLDILVNGSEEQQDTINENQDRIDHIKENMNKYDEATDKVTEDLEENLNVEESTEDINKVIDSEATESVTNVLSAFWGNVLIQWMTAISSGLMLVSFLLFGAH